MLLVVVSAHAHAQCERGNQRDLSLHKRLLMTCICRCGNRACCRICTCPRTGRRRVNQRDLPTMIVPAVTTMPQNNGPHARTHAPGHAEQPVQVGQTHLSFHSWRAEAHHRLHAALAVLLVGAVTASCTPAFLIEEITIHKYLPIQRNQHAPGHSEHPSHVCDHVHFIDHG